MSLSRLLSLRTISIQTTRFSSLAVSPSLSLPPLPASPPTPSATTHHVVLSVVSADRVGLVSSLSRVLQACDASVCESRMSRLGKEFAIIAHARVAGEMRTLEQGLKSMEGCEVIVRETLVGGRRRVEERWSVKLEVQDQKGVLCALAEEVEGWGGNIVRLETEKKGNSMLVRSVVNGVGGEGRLVEGVERVEKRFGGKAWVAFEGVEKGRRE